MTRLAGTDPHTVWDGPQTVGVLKEVKPYERRVALTPAGAAALVADGRAVIVETGAGEGSSHSDDE
jgi:alanine dehydrogenase